MLWKNETAIVPAVQVDGDLSDIHVRRDDDRVAWCNVYVWPHTPEGQKYAPSPDDKVVVNGYWYALEGEHANALALRFGL